MLVRKIEIDKTAKSYKSSENAEKAVDKLFETCTIDGAINYLITTNEEGRYTPVFFLNKDVFHLAFVIAAKGFTVVG